ncbi:MAG: DNA polymerase I [Saprospiraceae bacterium]|nr:DNA polymerase I [Saprospiraceae bacterium]MDP4819902.1 DNA polymerase I [Saprospiraceae bacterium]
MPEKKLYLLDGHALVYRAHFAFITRPLINSQGLNTSAISGFTRTLWDLLKHERPTHIAVAFDPPDNVFRHEWYPAYKANREEQPDDIKIAFPYIREILQAFRIPILTVNGFEADDVIGTIAKKAEKEGYTVYMVTPDKDYAQLVSDRIFMYKPSRQGNGVEILGVPEVLSSWDIERVEQVVDVLGLQGDAVDNIPGIPGIGAKTAVKLLKEFHSVEELIARSSELQGKQREKVEAFAEQGLLSKRLAQIDIAVPIEFDEEAFELEPFDRERLSELFRELEFRTLSRQLLEEDTGVMPSAKKSQSIQGNLFGEAVQEFAPIFSEAPVHQMADHHIDNTPHQYVLADSEPALTSLVERLIGSNAFCFDTETTGLDANLASLVGMSFSIQKHEAYYVPVPKNRATALQLLEKFRPVLENVAITKIGQNIKYDALILKWYGIELKGMYLDTMLMHYLLEPELRHNMDYMSETYLNYKPISIASLIGKKGKDQLNMRDLSPEKVLDYAAEDADITLQLQQYLQPKLEAEGLFGLYTKMEEPLIRALVDMEFEGIRIDDALLARYSVELGQEIRQLEEKIYVQAGEVFNIASPKQVGEILFDKMKIPYRWSKTKTGQYSTNEEKLAELALENPFVNDILQHRGLTKLKSTYVDTLPKLINPKTGRVHSSFNQALTATGRLSSNNPNMQNIPIRTEEGAKIREAFVPRNDEHVLLAADYSQIELRIIAEISQETNMLEAFHSGLDIHRATAARVFGVAYDEVSQEQRYRAKTVNFSIIYGAGSTNLSKQLGIKRAEAQELISQYFKEYQGLKNYMEETVAFAREKGYVKTLLGRRRYIREINSKSSLERSNAERIAVNSPIQGTAADLIKLAMVHIHQALKASNFKTRMILQVHDELVFDVPKEEVNEVRPLIETLMKGAIPELKVPVLVSTGIGANWREAH